MPLSISDSGSCPAGLLRPAPALGGEGSDKIAFNAVSAHGSASDRYCPSASTIWLTMANRSKVRRARRSIRVTVTTSPGARCFSILRSSRPVVVCAGHIFTVNLGTSYAVQLLKLAVERLARGADAGA